MKSEINTESGSGAAIHLPNRCSLPLHQTRRRPSSACWLLVAGLATALPGIPSPSHAANRVIAWGENGLGQANVPTGLTNMAAVAADTTAPAHAQRYYRLRSP